MATKDYVVYPAIFNDDPEGGYHVTFPDIPDTMTDGETLEEAFKNAPDALAVALPDYSPYPTPSPLEEVRKNNPNSIVNYVGVDMKQALKEFKDKPVRKNVSIPQSLAKWAKEKNINCSHVLTDALFDLKQNI